MAPGIKSVFIKYVFILRFSKERLAKPLLCLQARTQLGGFWGTWWEEGPALTEHTFRRSKETQNHNHSSTYVVRTLMGSVQKEVGEVWSRALSMETVIWLYSGFLEQTTITILLVTTWHVTACRDPFQNPSPCCRGWGGGF